MAAFPTPERLAQFSVRRPWTVVGIWAATLVVALVSASMIGEVLTTEGKNYVETDSVRADNLLEERLWGESPAAETIVVQSATTTVDDPRYEAFVRAQLGDKDGALALIERYLTANPEHREGFGKLNSWWWRPVKDDPRYARIVGSPR